MPRGRDEIRPMDENPSMEQLLGVPTIDGSSGVSQIRAIMAMFIVHTAGYPVRIGCRRHGL